MENRLSLLFQPPGYYRLGDPVRDSWDACFILRSFPGVVRLGL